MGFRATANLPMICPHHILTLSTTANKLLLLNGFHGLPDFFYRSQQEPLSSRDMFNRNQKIRGHAYKGQADAIILPCLAPLSPLPQAEIDHSSSIVMRAYADAGRGDLRSPIRPAAGVHSGNLALTAQARLC